MTVIVSKPAVNLREELASLRNQGGYQEQQFYFENAVTNGTFDADTDWTKGTGWTISGGVANKASGSASQIEQAGTLTTGRRYAVSMTGTRTAGAYQCTAGGFTGAVRTVSGTFTETFTCTNPSAVTRILSDGSFVGTVDNISIFEVDANDDVIYRMPKGWVPKDVFEDGLLQREGSAHDYEVVYDGFDYYVKPTVAPSATTQTCVIGVKA